jgi:hypothetical protein
MTSLNKMLLVNNTLMNLRLGEVSLTIAGIEKLSSSLKINQTLIYLSLEKNQIGDDQLQQLILALNHNKGI